MILEEDSSTSGMWSRLHEPWSPPFPKTGESTSKPKILPLLILPYPKSSYSQLNKFVVSQVSVQSYIKSSVRFEYSGESPKKENEQQEKHYNIIN